MQRGLGLPDLRLVFSLLSFDASTTANNTIDSLQPIEESSTPIHPLQCLQVDQDGVPVHPLDKRSRRFCPRNT